MSLLRQVEVFQIPEKQHLLAKIDLDCTDHDPLIFKLWFSNF